MNPSTRILYPHAWFAPAGNSWTTPSAGGPVSATAKPPVDAADANGDDLYFTLGALANGTNRPTIGNRKKIWTGAPGHAELKEEIPLKPEHSIMFTCQELTKLAIQALYHTAALSLDLTETAIQFNPGEGPAIITGWLKVQYYDQNDVFVKNVDQWSGLSFEGDFTSDQENNEYQLLAVRYFSPYNTGVLLPA